MECHACKKKGHMKNSKSCKKKYSKKEKVDQVQDSDTEDTDSDCTVGRVTEQSTEVVRQTGQGAGKCRVVSMEIRQSTRTSTCCQWSSSHWWIVVSTRP